MIREATQDDIPALVELARRHYARDPFAVEFDADGTAAWGRLALDLETMAFFVSDGGAFIGALAPVPWDKNRVAAQELWWCAEDGSGAKLLAAFEQWARARGATEMQIICTSTRRDAALERRMNGAGLRKSEINFMKVL